MAEDLSALGAGTGVSTTRTWSMADIHAAVAYGITAASTASATAVATPQPARARPRAWPIDLVGGASVGEDSGSRGTVTAAATATGADADDTSASAVPQSASSAAHGVVYHEGRVVCFYCHPDPAQLHLAGKKPAGTCKDLPALARHHMLFHGQRRAPAYLAVYLRVVPKHVAAASREAKRKQREELVGKNAELTADESALLAASQPKGRLQKPLRCGICVPEAEEPPTKTKRGWFWSLEAAKDHWKQKHKELPIPDELRHQRSRFTVTAPSNTQVEWQFQPAAGLPAAQAPQAASESDMEYRLCPFPNCGYITTKGANACSHHRMHILRGHAAGAPVTQPEVASVQVGDHHGDEDSKFPSAASATDSEAESESDDSSEQPRPAAPEFDYHSWAVVTPSVADGKLLPVDPQTGELIYGTAAAKCWEPQCYVFCSSYDEMRKHCEAVHDYFEASTVEFKTLDELDCYVHNAATEGDLVKVSGGMHGQQEWRCPLNGFPRKHPWRGCRRQHSKKQGNCCPARLVARPIIRNKKVVGYSCTYFSGHSDHEELRRLVPLPPQLTDAILSAMSKGASNETILRSLNVRSDEHPDGLAPDVSMSQLLYLRRTRHATHVQLAASDIASALLKMDVRDDSDDTFQVHRYLKLPGLAGHPHTEYDEVFEEDSVVLVTAVPEQLKLLSELTAPIVLYIDGTFKLTPFRNSVLIAFLVADPLSDRTLPICVGVAPSESEMAHQILLLETLKAPGAPSSIQVAAVVTDCTFAGANAMQEIMDLSAAEMGSASRPIAHFWCWWHITKALSDRLRTMFRGKANASTRNDIMRRMERLHKTTDVTEFNTMVADLRVFVNSLVDRRLPQNSEPEKLWEYLLGQWLKEGRREKWALCFRHESLRNITASGRAEAFNKVLKGALHSRQVQRFDESMDFIAQSLKGAYLRMAQRRRQLLPQKMPASKLARRTAGDAAAESTADFMARAMTAAQQELAARAPSPSTASIQFTSLKQYVQSAVRAAAHRRQQQQQLLQRQLEHLTATGGGHSVPDGVLGEAANHDHTAADPGYWDDFVQMTADDHGGDDPGDAGGAAAPGTEASTREDALPVDAATTQQPVERPHT